jgi:hypothetical protein
MDYEYSVCELEPVYASATHSVTDFTVKNGHFGSGEPLNKYVYEGEWQLVQIVLVNGRLVGTFERPRNR